MYVYIYIYFFLFCFRLERLRFRKPPANAVAPSSPPSTFFFSLCNWITTITRKNINNEADSIFLISLLKFMMPAVEVYVENYDRPGCQSRQEKSAKKPSERVTNSSAGSLEFRGVPDAGRIRSGTLTTWLLYNNHETGPTSANLAVIALVWMSRYQLNTLTKCLKKSRREEWETSSEFQIFNFSGIFLLFYDPCLRKCTGWLTTLASHGRCRLQRLPQNCFNLSHKKNGHVKYCEP